MEISESRHNAPLSYQVRPQVKGKFLVVDGEKFYIRGVTYGTFCPNEKGEHYPERAVIEKDFALMNYYGINSVRTYTVPPRYLLDSARENNLKVLIGLPWEQHINFLDDSNRIEEIEKKVRQGVLACANHPAVLAFTLGNEIPAPVVRWYGKRKLKNFSNGFTTPARRRTQMHFLLTSIIRQQNI